MSDIHGEREAFEDALSVVDFSDERTLLVLCGDYLDRFHLRPEFLTYIREFQERHEGQVVVLMGNHEDAYLEELGRASDPLFSDANGIVEMRTWALSRPSTRRRCAGCVSFRCIMRLTRRFLSMRG
ncbi:metallophosphoesterase [Arabiibacter massiliensis]|uniref:metallophosphoesterase n=1 Tax=Arabiibacter massiliensis TaxID=1870985 RepID=UPI00117A4074|nr:metallophosphoesterase [Arabiibacter massiliensis]